ncbi:O-linked N-acetylglucosamine transferase, SPINDLY family protein [Allorhizobium undicola]|uniref:O-linked N-acetylglucosamine transferase, SPINDLY family protein n=1 Tax=Allorhizobium undicola TaxID=78527 RepID=UPI000687CF1E|nr:hypothetical protein [Allorhizobium undicola]
MATALIQTAKQEFLRGAHQQALALANQAIAAGSTEAEAYIVAASAHEAMGARLEAAPLFVFAMAKAPALSRQLGFRAVAHYVEAGKPQLAIPVLSNLLQANPEDLDALHTLCSLYREAEDYHAARPHALKLAVLGRDFDNWLNAGIIFLGTGDHTAALPLLAAAHAARPGDRLALTEYFWCAINLCDFPLVRQLQARLEAAYAADGETLDIRENVFRSLQWSGDEAYHVLSAINTARQRIGRAAPRRPYRGRSSSRLRIGYVSADYCDHATLALFAGVLEAHDRERFEIFGICHTPAPLRKGALRQRFLDAIDHYVDILALGDDDAARMIAALDLDILVDLKGFTRDHRLGIFARRPVPIQVTYLGFPGSVAGVGIDYAITDAIVTPDSARPFYAETLFTLPDSYQCNDSRRLPVLREGSRSAFGLPEEGFVFCSFNQAVKIRPEVFDAWMSALEAVPGSVLWLIDMVDTAKNNLRRAATERGIDPARLIFAPKLPMDAHLQRLCHADLALDTSPYNGHTTTADALWAGVPVVTFKGSSFASRVCESLLNAVGLRELVAEDLQAFGRLAAELAQDGNRLSRLRHHLYAARQTAPLFDTSRFTRNFEKALLAIEADAAEWAQALTV